MEYISEVTDELTQCTLEYLQAMNQLFEDGFLGHDVVTSMDCVTMKKIEGYLFLIRWLDQLLDKGTIILKLHVMFKFAAFTLVCLIRTGPNKSLSIVLSCLAGSNQ